MNNTFDRPIPENLQHASEALSAPFASIRLDRLADEIVTHHHAYVREQGPRILALLAKVSQAHIKTEPRLLALWSVFERMHRDLLAHMLKEESVLFPYCKQLEFAESAVSMHCGSVMNPIRVMTFEHQQTEAEMEQLKALSDDFSPPPGACRSWQALYQALEAYIEDLETHMQLENDQLFPSAIQREQELKKRHSSAPGP